MVHNCDSNHYNCIAWKFLMQIRGKEEKGKPKKEIFLLPGYKSFKSFWFPNLGQLEHVYLALLMAKSHFPTLRTLHLITVLLARRAAVGNYIKLSGLQRENRKKIHGKLEVQRSHSNPMGWCIAVLFIWRGCSSWSILLWEVKMGRRNTVISKMGLLPKEQPWKKVLFSALSQVKQPKNVWCRASSGSLLCNGDCPSTVYHRREQDPSCYTPRHLVYLLSLHLAHRAHYMPVILSPFLPYTFAPNCHCLRTRFQTPVTVQIASETQLGTGTCGKVWNSFSSGFLLWVCSWLLTHKNICGYISNFKCHERCRVNEKYEIIDGEAPLPVPRKYQVNEFILGKLVNIFLFRISMEI